VAQYGRPWVAQLPRPRWLSIGWPLRPAGTEAAGQKKLTYLTASPSTQNHLPFVEGVVRYMFGEHQRLRNLLPEGIPAAGVGGLCGRGGFRERDD
jgi:hypothetical protein